MNSVLKMRWKSQKEKKEEKGRKNPDFHFVAGIMETGVCVTCFVEEWGRN